MKCVDCLKTPTVSICLHDQIRSPVLPRISVHATVVNKLGLHARPAMAFVDLAGTFTSTVTVRRADIEVDGKSIMQMMMLAAGRGSDLEIIADGEDAEAAATGLKALVDGGFDEE